MSEDYANEWSMGEKIRNRLATEAAEQQAVNPCGSLTEGEPLALTIEPPKHHCGTHGEHPHWISCWITGEPTNLYCMRCIMDFLDRQSIGKHVLPPLEERL